jgi:hypothetical protein
MKKLIAAVDLASCSGIGFHFARLFFVPDGKLVVA